MYIARPSPVPLLATHVPRLTSSTSPTCPSSRRSFFGIGEVLGVITNPSEVLRSLAESRRLLEETRKEIQESSERAQIPTSHTFAPLPGFEDRPREIRAIERSLGGVPAFTILFGASSVGKTALLRQVLSSDEYHVLHFDLRIAGFADLPSLYLRLADQMESYFSTLPELLGEEWGWKQFEKESWAFKHDRLAIEKRMEQGGQVKTSDIAHLMELFQSALLKYWQFEPMSEGERAKREQEKEKEAASQEEEKQPEGTSSLTNVVKGEKRKKRARDRTEQRMRSGWTPRQADISTTANKKPNQKEESLQEARSLGRQDDHSKRNDESKAQQPAEEVEEEEARPAPKKIPVFLLDEAHKLPALIKADDAMKTILDAFLVLTKQDRLAHVIHATSDPFYMHWLRQMNVMQHCHILSIGDCSKQEAQRYFEHSLLSHVPEKLRSGISFERVYEVFGGKLAHLADYTNEYINSDGKISPLQSSHFLQAHSLLNLHLIHSKPIPTSGENGSESESSGTASAGGFQIYSALNAVSPHASPGPYNESSSGTAGEAMFTDTDLLSVMRRLAPSPPTSEQSLDQQARRQQDDDDQMPAELLYFPLCHELGARAVDGMVRGRILELRWNKTITYEGDERLAERAASREVPGPTIVPTTPVVRYAMGEVLKEYDERSGRV